MKRIKLISGTCGVEAHREDGSIYWVYKSPKDAPFLCPDDLANTLISSGRASVIESFENFEPTENVVLEDQDDLMKLSMKELKAKAKECGLAFNSHISKAELIEAIREAELDG